ncbi:DNA polymerase I [Rickettsiales bacterium LUAb2]
MVSNSSKKLALIDGSGFIFRAFHALPSLTKRDGTEVNAVYGFTKMVMSLIEGLKVDYVAVIFDAARETFRNEIYKEYKANRPPAPPELIPQFALIREAVRALNLVCIEKQGFEADDLIATYANLAKNANIETMIVSSDKDLMQLVEDPYIYMYDSMKKKYIKKAEVIEKFGVEPNKLIYAQALIGDSVDNVPGIKGLGPKTAASLINQFGDLDGIFANLAIIDKPSVKSKLAEGKESAFVSLDLVTLKTDVPIDIPIEELVLQEINPYLLYGFLEEQEFKSLAINIAQKYKIDLSSVAKAKAENNSLFQQQVVSDQSLAKQEQRVITSNQQEKINHKYCYKLINNLDNLNDMLKELSNAVNVYFHFNSTAISLMADNNCVYLIPLANKSLVTDFFQEEHNELKTNITNKDLSDSIASIFSDKSINKVAYNLKKARYALNAIGVNNIDSGNDLEVMNYVVNGVNDNNLLNNLVNKVLLCDQQDIEAELSLQIQHKELRDLFQETLCIKQIYQILTPKIVFDKVKHIYEQIDKPLIEVLYQMEQAGVLVSPEVLLELGKDIDVEINKLEQEIYKLAGEEFNIASPKQIGELLFVKLGIKGKKNKSGSWKTEVNFLEELDNQGVEIAGLIINWRKFSKLKNTYIEVLPKHINLQTGRIHTSFLQSSTSTGRLSSLDPNLQNIPIKSESGKQIRSAFIAKSGYKIISLDYSQIELRLLADIANINSLIMAFKNGEDIHNITAKEIFNLDGEVSSEYRRKAKTINFGIIYGISEFGLARRLQLSREESKRYINTYFERYPEILQYMEKAKQEAREYKYVLTSFGRKCHIDGINSSNHAAKSFAERAAINAKLQGSAADIIRIAMIESYKYLINSQVDAKLILQIHDELLIEVKEDLAEQVAKDICEIMQNVCRLKVPLEVNYSIGNNWLLAH